MNEIAMKEIIRVIGYLSRKSFPSGFLPVAQKQLCLSFLIS